MGGQEGPGNFVRDILLPKRTCTGFGGVGLMKALLFSTRSKAFSRGLLAASSDEQQLHLFFSLRALYRIRTRLSGALGN